MRSLWRDTGVQSCGVWSRITLRGLGCLLNCLGCRESPKSDAMQGTLALIRDFGKWTSPDGRAPALGNLPQRRWNWLPWFPKFHAGTVGAAPYIRNLWTTSPPRNPRPWWPPHRAATWQELSTDQHPVRGRSNKSCKDLVGARSRGPAVKSLADLDSLRALELWIRRHNLQPDKGPDCRLLGNQTERYCQRRRRWQHERLVPVFCYR